MTEEMNIIESINNKKIQMWSKLKRKKERDSQGLFIVEGIKLVEEAIIFNQEVETIVFNRDIVFPDSILALAEKKELDTVAVPDNIFKKLADTESPQGVLAVCKKKAWSIDEVVGNADFFLLIDEIQDPGNLGAIIRSADAAGVGTIILGDNTVDLYNQKVIRSTMGSIFHFPIVNYDLTDVIEKLKGKNIKIIGTSPYAEQVYFESDLSKNVAVLVGNESKGLSKERQAQVDQMVNIPILGKAESLNVAMATSVILFEHVRQVHQIKNN